MGFPVDRIRSMAPVEEDQLAADIILPLSSRRCPYNRLFLVRLLREPLLILAMFRLTRSGWEHSGLGTFWSNRIEG